MATHPPEIVYVDDDWALPRILPPGSAAPGNTLEWVLATRGALAQVIAPEAATIETIDEASGSVLVKVPRTITATLSPGRYFDALRVLLDGNGVVTQVVGSIHVVNPGFVIEAE
jgi:hypothetical protein